MVARLWVRRDSGLRALWAARGRARWGAVCHRCEERSRRRQFHICVHVVLPSKISWRARQDVF